MICVFRETKAREICSVETLGLQTICRRAKRERRWVLHYRLYRTRRGEYCICIRCGARRESARDVAENLETARRYFNRLVEGVVFPCHLKDVLEDFLSECE